MVLSRFGTIDNFMMVEMSPNRQIEVHEKREDFMLGDYPTLNNVASAYGRTAPIQWLMAQLTNLSEFCGVKDKLVGDQLEELAWLLAGEYSYYMVTQFLVFFHDFKIGRYGKFYGVVDPLVITTAIKEFDKERIRLVSAKEREEERKRLDEESKFALKADDVNKLLGEIRNRPKDEYSEDSMRQAIAIEENAFNVSDKVLCEYRKLFKKHHGIEPREYIEKYENTK